MKYILIKLAKVYMENNRAKKNGKLANPRIVIMENKLILLPLHMEQTTGLLTNRGS
ncbi:MAG: hypothetical protein ACI86M_002132 [Saprospiraceae bacterium]|jgi:hypothetical protein|tara:strand:- start:609 stop:776 length:168 start_codon:yes stop_codon:yes gene_type:complete